MTAIRGYLEWPLLFFRVFYVGLVCLPVILIDEALWKRRMKRRR